MFVPTSNYSDYTWQIPIIHRIGMLWDIPMIFLYLPSGNLTQLLKITISCGKIHYFYDHYPQLCLFTGGYHIQPITIRTFPYLTIRISHYSISYYHWFSFHLFLLYLVDFHYIPINVGIAIINRPCLMDCTNYLRIYSDYGDGFLLLYQHYQFFLFPCFHVVDAGAASLTSRLHGRGWTSGVRRCAWRRPTRGLRSVGTGIHI